MNIRQAKEEIKNTIRVYLRHDNSGNFIIPEHRQRPILLMGPPGIGKTRIMEQISEELGIGLASYALTHHTRQTALGLPTIVDRKYNGEKYTATEYTMSEIISDIYEVMRRTGRSEGILFLDEINCISETLMPAMLQLLQQKRFGSRSIPSGWVIVAAGNPPEYNRSARRFDIVTLDRVRLIELSADREVWNSYATDAGVHGAVISFLELKPAYFFTIKKDVDGVTYATPRGWEDLSDLIRAYETENLPITAEIIREYIHDSDISEDMAVYLQLYNRYRDDYQIESILQGEAPPSLYERLLSASYDEKVALIRLLLDGLNLRFDGDAASQSAAAAALKNAFAFIAETMGEGNELLLFLTGLTDSTAAIMHMMEYPSEEYMRYSDELLGDGRRAAILKDM